MPYVPCVPLAEKFKVNMNNFFQHPHPMWKPQPKHKPFLLLISIIVILLVANAWQSPKSLREQSGSSGGSSPSFFSENAIMQDEAYDADYGAEKRLAAPQVSTDIFPPPFEPTAGETAADVDQKIIKTGSLELMVNDVSQTATKISSLATGTGGFVQDSSVSQTENGSRYGGITIRVPVEHFEQTFQTIKSYANLVKNESQNGQDITEQYTDLEAQLRNNKAQEQRYLDILASAKTVEEILSVERELTQTRQMIEQLQGRMQYLENQTSFSTISIFLSEETFLKIPTESFRPWQAVKEAAQALVLLGQQLITKSIWFVIVGGGILLPLALIIWVIVLIVKKRRK